LSFQHGLVVGGFADTDHVGDVPGFEFLHVHG
jgi:hypothetical protein